MASINSSTGNDNNQAPKQYYNFRMYYNAPLDISLSTQCIMNEFNGKKYPSVKTYMQISLSEKSNGVTSRNAISLTAEDWYRWMITVGELLSKAKTIYVDNHISEKITEDDFKTVSFRGEVLQMVPLMAKKDEDLIPAVRIIVNDPAKFADFPLIDIKTMYNVLSKIDVFTASLIANTLGVTV